MKQKIQTLLCFSVLYIKHLIVVASFFIGFLQYFILFLY